MEKQYVLSDREKESYERIARENIELQRKINSGIKWYHKVIGSIAGGGIGFLLGIVFALALSSGAC